MGLIAGVVLSPNLCRAMGYVLSAVERTIICPHRGTLLALLDLERGCKVSIPAPHLWTEEPQLLMKREKVSKLRFKNYI